jgi:LmbE family N-acetylglucosaminyl deacetylase
MHSRSVHAVIRATALLVVGLIASVTGCTETSTAREACIAGAVRTRACGACDTGVETFTCADDGTSELLIPCTGEDENLPIDPRSMGLICAHFDDPMVFIAPHPDDESIGMAGAILEGLGQGRPVFIEVMTHGEMSKVHATLDDGGVDSWHPGKHHYKLTTQEFGDARVREVFEAAVRLGVTGVHVHGFRNGGLTPDDVAATIQYWVKRSTNLDGVTALSLRGTAGAQDPQGKDGLPHPDHKAVWDALAASGLPDVQGYCVYDYTEHKSTPDQIYDISPWCAAKRAVLESYKVWDPDVGRFAVGEHSVRDLLAKAGHECHELVVYPPPPELSATAAPSTPAP